MRHPLADRNDIDGVRIVLCGKRLSVTLASLTECQYQRMLFMIYLSGCVCVCMSVCDGGQWCMRVHSDDRSFHASSIVTT